MATSRANSRLPILLHVAAALAGATIFNLPLMSPTTVQSMHSSFLFLLSCAASSLFCVAFSSAYIRLTNGQGCAAAPFLPGVIAALPPLAVGTYMLFLTFTGPLGSPPEAASWICGVFFNSGCLLALRVWAFITPVVTEVAYEELPGDFYHDSTKSEHVGGFRAWYHGGRYVELQSTILRSYKEGDRVYDFGCGGAEWNRSHLPVVGIDVNRGLLESGMAKGQLAEIVVAELHNTGLPDSSADIVIISEVVEHMVDPKSVLSEIRRCLKPGGTLILTVPWDTPFSPFFWLFNIQCFYRGYVLGEDYYRQRCGHVNHFSGPRLKRLLLETGLNVQSLYRFRGLLLYSISYK